MIDVKMNERIDRGIAWMDEHAPADWREKIDFTLLDMQGECTCIIGQVFGSFWKLFGRGKEAGKQSYDEAIAMGFAKPMGAWTYLDAVNGWDRLKAAWIKKLEEQKNPETVPQRRTAEVVAV